MSFTGRSIVAVKIIFKELNMNIPASFRSRAAQLSGGTAFLAYLLGRWYFGENMGVATLIEGIVAALGTGFVVHLAFFILDRD